MNREFVVHIKITRAAARLALGAALLWLPAGTLVPATHELAFSTVLPAPVASFSNLQVNGKAILASNNGADVQISTTSCVPGTPSGGWAKFVRQPNMTNLTTNCGGGGNQSDSRAGVRILTNKNTGGAETPFVAEAYNAKLFIRGDISTNRLIWYWNNNPGSAPDREFTYWPDEITGFAAQNCTGGYDANTGQCAFGTYDASKSEVVLNWTVKNGTGPSPGYYRTYVRRSTNNNLNQALVVMRSNSRPTTTAPYLSSPNNACQAIEACQGGVPCPTGRAVCIKGCKYDMSATDPMYDLVGQCQFKIEQNITGNFPYRADVRVMCVKMSQERWDSECATVPIPANRHPDCRMRCPANPETMACPYDPAQNLTERCTW